jgi:hypothetical protein
MKKNANGQSEQFRKLLATFRKHPMKPFSGARQTDEELLEFVVSWEKAHADEIDELPNWERAQINSARWDIEARIQSKKPPRLRVIEGGLT